MQDLLSNEWLQRLKIHIGGAMKKSFRPLSFSERMADKERGGQRNQLLLICDACKIIKDSPQVKGLSYFNETLWSKNPYGVNKSRYSIFRLRSMEGTIFPFHLLKSTYSR